MRSNDSVNKDSRVMLFYIRQGVNKVTAGTKRSYIWLSIKNYSPDNHVWLKDGRTDGRTARCNHATLKASLIGGGIKHKEQNSDQRVITRKRTHSHKFSNHKLIMLYFILYQFIMASSLTQCNLRKFVNSFEL